MLAREVQMEQRESTESACTEGADRGTAEDGGCTVVQWERSGAQRGTVALE